MEHVKNGNHKHPTEKSRATMRRELEELQALLQQRETELTACQEGLAHAAADIQRLQEESAEHRKQLQDAQEATERLHQQSQQFEKNIELLREREAHLREEKDDLKKAIDVEKEKTIKLVEEANAEQRKAEHTSHELERRLREFEETKIAGAEEVSSSDESSKTDTEPITAPSATFRIYLYPRQGHYVGRIEHSLSQDKTPFKGLDQEAIMRFIASHLPQVVEKMGEAMPTPVSSVARARTSRTRDVHHERAATGQMSSKAFARTDALRRATVRPRQRLIRGKPSVVKHGMPFMVDF